MDFNLFSVFQDFSYLTQQAPLKIVEAILDENLRNGLQKILDTETDIEAIIFWITVKHQ